MENGLKNNHNFFWSMGADARLRYLTDGEPLRIDEVSPALTYIGYAPVTANPALDVWKIKKIEVIGTETITSYADGDKEYNNIWNDRLTLTYL